MDAGGSLVFARQFSSCPVSFYRPIKEILMGGIFCVGADSHINPSFLKNSLTWRRDASSGMDTK
jgi:hypothetical protein